MKNKYFWVLAYLTSIIISNILVIKFGIIHIFYLTFPAGVIFVGLTFSFRDYVQNYWGDYVCWVWMFVATIITYFFNQQIAIASLLAFIVSESIDWFGFKVLKMPLYKRIYISNFFSCPIDSLIFISIAFGWIWPAILGQTIIKYLSGLLVLPFIRRKKK